MIFECKAYQVNKADGTCNTWASLAKADGNTPDAKCNIKDLYDAADEDVDGYTEQVGSCRRETDNGHDGSLATHYSYSNVEVCKAACTSDDSCIASEFGDSGCYKFQQDSLSQYHGYVEKPDGAICYLKTTSANEEIETTENNEASRVPYT